MQNLKQYALCILLFLHSKLNRVWQKPLIFHCFTHPRVLRFVHITHACIETHGSTVIFLSSPFCMHARIHECEIFTLLFLCSLVRSAQHGRARLVSGSGWIHNTLEYTVVVDRACLFVSSPKNICVPFSMNNKSPSALHTRMHTLYLQQPRSSAKTRELAYIGLCL